MIRKLCISASPQPWSAGFFLGVLLFYFAVILVQALPSGSVSQLTLGVPNPECIDDPNAASPVYCKKTKQITLRSTAEDYLEFFEGGDPGSYVRGGLFLAGKNVAGAYPGWGEPDMSGGLFKRLYRLNNTYGYGTWPPGMFLLNALPLSVNVDAPLGLYHVLASATVWAAAFSLLAAQLATHLRRPIALILPASIMSFPLFHDYLFRFGAMYSDTYAAAFAVIGLTLLFANWHSSNNKKLLFLAGLCFAAASFFRSPMLAVSVGLALLFLAATLLEIYRKDLRLLGEFRRSNLLPFILALAVPLCGYTYLNNGSFVRYPGVSQLPFTLQPFPDAGMQNFLALGGMRAACEADRVNCTRINSAIMEKRISEDALNREIVMAFLRHPIQFSAYKLPIAWKYWISKDSAKLTYSLESAIFLGLLIGGIAYLMLLGKWLFLSVTLAFCVSIFAPPFLLMHFELRYFHPVKVFAAFMPFLALLHLWSSKRLPAKREPCRKYVG
jgi:hypothetical protein